MSDVKFPGREQFTYGGYTVLDQPERQLANGNTFDIYAVTDRYLEDGTPVTVPAAFVKTEHDITIQMLGEFSGKPTGELRNGVRVSGIVDGSRLYKKTIDKSTILSGLRTTLAQRKAARLVRRAI